MNNGSTRRSTERKSAGEIRVLIAAGGTGGHLFPALHVARALRGLSTASRPVRIEFVGSGRPLERKLIDPAGYCRHEIDVVGVKNRGLPGLLDFCFRLPRAVAQVWRLLREYRPDVILGIGGYVSVLPILIGRIRGAATWIHEAEIKPGLANYFLSFIAQRVSIAFAETVMPCARHKIAHTGQPVRDGLVAVSETAALPVKPNRILVLGGSQGARAVDTAMASLLDFFREKEVEIWHQCRAEDGDQLRAAYQSAGVAAKVETFIDNPVAAYRWSHIVISRSGANAVMEIGVVNKPAIFVPYPYAQGRHQTANALTLVNQGKALLVEEGDGFTARLREGIEKLLDGAVYERMRAQPWRERPTAAAELIAQGSLGLVRTAE